MTRAEEIAGSLGDIATALIGLGFAVLAARTATAPAGADEAAEPWLSKKQAAAHLAVTPRCLTNWQRGEGAGGLGLPHRRLPGGTCLYRRSELDEFVAAIGRAE